ncbi:transporter substrate-binding domain-containing protein [Verticiella sediminum]|uniref:Transporter substrate-binding domain-containing protein n=2 Tax=Verticiella sediminum TaxID=1247510 RepID=A0A556AMW4_9BURK|nr:transporter substrate-binding domain-containing protein [Verticiella sediminum]
MQRCLAALGLATALAAAPLAAHAQAPSTMEQIKQSGVMRIGVAPGDPYYFKDPATGQWTGLGVLIAEEVAKDLGVKVQTVETTWGNAVAGLQAGQMDVMFILDATEERKKAADFTDEPLFWYAQGVLVRDGLSVKTWDDLDQSGTRVGVGLGTAPDRDLTKRLQNATIERFGNNDEAVAALFARRVDAIGFYTPVLAVAYSRIKKGEIVIPSPVVALSTSAGMRKQEDQAFKEYLDGEFRKLYESGRVQELYAQYLKGKGVEASSTPSLIKEQWAQ